MFPCRRLENLLYDLGLNMARINDNYLKLKAGYLFPEIGRRVAKFAAGNPQTAPAG